MPREAPTTSATFFGDDICLVGRWLCWISKSCLAKPMYVVGVQVTLFVVFQALIFFSFSAEFTFRDHLSLFGVLDIEVP